MHTALDCKDPTLDDGYPHPILWRVHYATLCVSNWGSAELKALIYGLLQDEDEDEDEEDEDEDDEEDDEDDGDDEEENEDEVHQMKRGKMCEFILHNFVVNSPATIA
jgi:ABC-type Zn2+ transport system substrate-binding protein/surface adhesin